MFLLPCVDDNDENCAFSEANTFVANGCRFGGCSAKLQGTRHSIRAGNDLLLELLTPPAATAATPSGVVSATTAAAVVKPDRLQREPIAVVVTSTDIGAAAA